ERRWIVRHRRQRRGIMRQGFERLRVAGDRLGHTQRSQTFSAVALCGEAFGTVALRRQTFSAVALRREPFGAVTLRRQTFGTVALGREPFGAVALCGEPFSAVTLRRQAFGAVALCREPFSTVSLRSEDVRCKCRSVMREHRKTLRIF